MTSNNTPGPPAQEYGADEISALVLDPGYSLTRAGFAGEDTPKSVIPSLYGTPSDGSSKLVFDDNAIHNPLSYLDIKNPMSKEGVVEDWDVAAKLWEYAITSRLTGPRQTSAIRNGLNDDPKENGGDDEGDVKMEEATEELEKPLAESPLLMTEPGWNPVKNREKSIEIAMEDWGTPAFYLGRAGVLAAFASGKPSALVVDLGASTTSVTPVYDGLMLKKGTVKSPLAGNWISDQIRILLSQQTPPVQLHPHYLIASKTAVDAGAPPQFTKRTFANPPTASFHRLQEDRVLHEFKEGCVQVWNPTRHLGQPLSSATEILKSSEPGRPWELPDGWNNVWGVDRYRVVEGLFDEKSALTDSETPAPSAPQTLRPLMRQALSTTDVDTRQQLLSNVIVTGGSSLIQGLTDRISFELTTEYPGARVRLNAPGNYAERTFASWIGGSILASLGSFHQMWISKKEYDEAGPNIVEKRCK